MEDVNIVNVLVRLLHIVGAMALVGGLIFARFVVQPSMRALPQDARQAMHDDLRRRFIKLFMFAVAALLLSGFYNYLHNEMPKHEDQSLYAALIGIKILLALLVFFLGSALLGRAAVFQGLRKNAKVLMAVNVAAAIVVVAMAALLRALPDVAAAHAP